MNIITIQGDCSGAAGGKNNDYDCNERFLQQPRGLGHIRNQLHKKIVA